MHAPIWLQIFGGLVGLAFIFYMAVELSRGGGDPNHKDHNPKRR